MGFEDRREHLAATPGNVDHSTDTAKIISLGDSLPADRRPTSHRIVEDTRQVPLLLGIGKDRFHAMKKLKGHCHVSAVKAFSGFDGAC
jgi:hypothetical protein